MSSSGRLEKLKDHLDTINPTQSGGGGGLGRGRSAKDPREIPAAGWKDVLVRSWGQVSDNNIFIAAGGVTYAILVALFPGLAAFVSIYGLLLNPAEVEAQMNTVSSILPPESSQMIGEQLHKLVQASTNTLSISAGIALLFALWSASRGMSGLIGALNMAYEQKETRGFFKLNALAVGLTLVVLVGGTVTIALVGILPVVIQWAGFGPIAKWVLLILEWPLLISVVMTGLAVLYRYAPDRKEAQWRWVSPGTTIATLLWVIGSLGFTIYVSHFNSYDKTYGSLGGVVVMLTWLWLSAFVSLFGAVINAESERQTVADTTVGRSKPLGTRKAYAADTVAPSPR